jgi:glycosyltransferase involved in cell wall biosynthesis
LAKIYSTFKDNRRKLNIALVAPLVTPIAPPFIGGAQVLLHDLAVGLAKRGHTITLYAAKGSNVPGVKLIELNTGKANLNLADFTMREQTGQGAEATAAYRYQEQLFLEIFLDIAQNNKYNIAHAHAFDLPCYAFGALCRVPTVHTVHLAAVDNTINYTLANVYRKTGSSRCVTVSQACAATYTEFFQFDKVIYNGLAIKQMPFGAKGKDFLLFVGRMSPEKGVDKAIEIALKANKRLVMFGAKYHQAYFDQKIAPLLAKHPELLDYRGETNREEIWQWMSRAEGLLFTPQWEEAFGLVLAEAQATGLPVIAFDRGACREIILPNQTGFLLRPNDIDGAVLAIQHLGIINRHACRERIAQAFSIEKMLIEYEDYYYSVCS